MEGDHQHTISTVGGETQSAEGSLVGGSAARKSESERENARTASSQQPTASSQEPAASRLPTDPLSSLPF